MKSLPALILIAGACALAPGARARSAWSAYGQGTLVVQGHAAFAAAYSGPQSLSATAQRKETADLTLYAGRALWRGAEFWLDAEFDQGFGLDNTLGTAGFPSGEAYKIGANRPYPRLPRAFVRQVFELGGPTQAVEAAPNQLEAAHSANNVTVTLGRFSVVDVFDNNAYAHDPRGDFLNWALIDAGSFDYAADAWGYTNGAAVEWNQGRWTLRGGLFQMSPVPNSKVSGLHGQDRSTLIEAEERHSWGGHDGKVRLLVWNNRAAMASYADALAWGRSQGTAPDPAPVRRLATDTGWVVNVEQELAPDLGWFARVSANGGKKEAYEFSDINRAASTGVSLAGSSWGRGADRVGVALAVNELSGDARAFFEAGGLGILIGDGRMNYGRERIAEAYYALSLGRWGQLGLDFQRIANPAYNRDRGPVSVWALRLHAAF
ncbi:MAG: carbohydrate porin [Burkholderiales bacterium]|nr:carbohydrate porin [Burkholderiales bacterium]MDE1928452.1 carbohydrate porin [Burkholderiales bacterium]MDE2160951.1 carbohydrate porin [Burkholderiales bacterium]MDE2504453.1 carbohydrate porin [Burkholderiales bacterium]